MVLAEKMALLTVRRRRYGLRRLLLCAVLPLVTACASEEPQPPVASSATPAPVSQTITQPPAGSAVLPVTTKPVPPSPPPATSGVVPVSPPTQGQEVSARPEAAPASPTGLDTPPARPAESPPPASSESPTPPVEVTRVEGDRPPSPTGPKITFFDSNVFDKQLASSLRSGADTVVVTLETPASVNDIPPRLNRWFSAVEKYDGAVELRPDPDYPVIAQRTLATEAISLVFGALKALYDAIADKILYSPAKGYNTTVYYIKGSGVMTKVVFTRKPQQS